MNFGEGMLSEDIFKKKKMMIGTYLEVKENFHSFYLWFWYLLACLTVYNSYTISFLFLLSEASQVYLLPTTPICLLCG